MKIGHLDKQPIASVAGERTGAPEAHKATGGVKTAHAPSVESSTKVELSSQAAMLSTQGSSADFDADKVQRVAQAMRDGKFQVNHAAIADKLINNAQEFLSRSINQTA